MAARTNKTTHDEKTKELIAASHLINLLIKHVKGEIEMSATQVHAAKIVIGKRIPDLKAIEISGTGPEGSIPVSMTVKYVKPNG